MNSVSPSPSLSFLQRLEKEYPIDTIFQGVSGDVHAILQQKRIPGPAGIPPQLELLEKMMDVDPDTTGIVGGYRLSVIDRIRHNIWFRGLLGLGDQLKTKEHKQFFSQLLFSYMWNRLKEKDAAFDSDMQDFGDFCQKKWFSREGSMTEFIQKSPAYYDAFSKKKVAA